MVEMLSRVGWSQRYFARLMGVSEDTVNGWCRKGSGGPGKECALRYLELVSRVLGV